MMLILEVIGRRNENGSNVDLDQIIDRVDYDVTKSAIQFTIRNMIEKGFIEKCGFENRRNRRRILFRVTKDGYDVYSGLVGSV